MQVGETIINNKLQEQKALNEAELAKPLMYEEDHISELVYEYEDKPKVSDTVITTKDDVIKLCRFIERKLYKVEFNIDVRLVDVMNYFELEDKLFIRCCR